MERILDLEKGFDIETFDRVVATALSSFAQNKDEAERVLLEFKELPGSWTKIDYILKHSEKQQSKFIALQILEDSVRTKWSLFSEEMKLSLRQYVFTTVVERAAGAPDLILEKFDGVLIEIAKKDWPQKWGTFIADLIGVSQSTSMGVARNTLRILQSMNEQVFLVEEGTTTARRRLLRATLQQEYFSIFRFISLVLKYSESQEMDDALLKNCLNAFSSFCKSMPLEFVFSTEIVDHVLAHLNSPHSVAALECLLEIVELERGEFLGDEEYSPIGVKNEASGMNGPTSGPTTSISRDKIVVIHDELLSFFKLYLGKFGETETLASAYERMAEPERIFVRKYAKVFSSLYALWLGDLEETKAQCGLGYLVEISKIDDPAVFRTVFPMWSRFVYDLYAEYPLRVHTAQPLRRGSYTGILQAMLAVFVQNMPKPEEVFILVNELGEIVKDRSVETAEIDFYKRMRSNLFFLSFLIEGHMKNHFIRRIERYISADTRTAELSTAYRHLNQLSWAMGALAGAFEEASERDFFVAVINNLLTICEIRPRREEKAILASNIMFIIGQYHRFLKFNNEFFFVVIRKLFEFMNEAYEGIKEMACDNFYKICEKCPNQFFIKRSGCYVIDTIIADLGSIIGSLDFYLQRVVLEGLLLVISNGPRKDIEHVRAIYQALTSQAVLTPPYIDSIHVAIADRAQLLAASHVIESHTLGYKTIPVLFAEFARIDTFVYFYAKCAEKDSRPAQILKRALALLLEAAVDAKAASPDALNSICGCVLADYKASFNEALLPLASAIVRTGGLASSLDASSVQRIHFFISGLIAPSVPLILKADEHTALSTAFLSFLSSLVQGPFTLFFPLLAESHAFEPTINAILFALTSLREISSLALQLLHLIYKACLDNRLYFFYSRFYLISLENILGLVFDKDMKSNYSLQIDLLFFLISSLGAIPPLSPEASNAGTVKQFVTDLFSKSFSNLTPTSISIFVEGLVEIKQVALFKEHIDDFNVKVYEYGNDDDAAAELELLKERVAKGNS